MPVLRMKYHPAKKEVRFQRFEDNNEDNNGIPIGEYSSLKGYENMKGSFILQDQGKAFFDDIVREFDSQTFRIEVVTTKNDYEDFEQMVEFYNAYNPPVQIRQNLRSKLPDMDITFKKVIEHGYSSIAILRASQDNLFEVLRNNNNAVVEERANILAADVQKEIDNIEEKIEATSDNNVNLCFTGIYNSGKSTLINAIIGYRILPQAMRSETARIFHIQSPKEGEPERIDFYIRDVHVNLVWIENEKVFKFKPRPVVNTLCEDIQNIIDSNIGEKHDQIYEILRMLNTIAGISNIYVYFPIPLDNDKVKFVIYDTPGTDSNYREYEKELEKALLQQTHSILIFVAPANRLEGEGYKTLLNYLRRAEENDSKTTIDIGRSLFVINIADMTDIKDRENLQKRGVISNRNDPGSSIRLSDKKLFFTSAVHAYVASAAKNEIATESDKRIIQQDYDRMLGQERGMFFLQNHCASSESATNKLLKKSEDALKDAIARVDKEEVFHICSGLYSLEEEIKLYGKKFAVAVKVFAIIDIVDRALSRIKTTAQSLETQNRVDINNINRETEVFRLGITNRINEARTILDNKLLPNDISLKLEDLNKTFIDKLMLNIKRELRGWFLGLGRVRFNKEHKERISGIITSALDVFKKDFLEKRQNLLEDKRDSFIKIVKEKICDNNDKITEEAEGYFINVPPPIIGETYNTAKFNDIYNSCKREDKFFFKTIENVDKRLFIEKTKEKLKNIAGILATNLQNDFHGSLNIILSRVESDFILNLNKYSVFMKAKFENIRAIDELRISIASLADELKVCQDKLEEIIWREEVNE